MRLRPSRQIEHHRRLIATNRIAANRLTRHGRELIDLASNDYLGLATDARLIEAAKSAADQFGSGAGASPAITGHSTLHQELLDTIAAYKKTSSALVFPCGFSANVAAISALAGPDDVVLCDRLSHASLIDGCRLSGATTRFFRHRDMAQLKSLLERASDKPCFVVTEGLFSMDGTTSPIEELLELCKHFEATLILDEAHSNGVCGSNGHGLLCGDIATHNVRVVHVGTLSKAFAAQGGFVASDSASCDLILNLGRTFLFSTSLAPPMVGAAKAAIEILLSEPHRIQRLNDIASRLHNELSELEYSLLGDPGTPIVSIVTGTSESAVALSTYLESNGILAPAIRPPTVKAGSERLRLSVNAALSDQQLEHVMRVLSERKESMP